jgi:hypothetical protein
MLSTAQRVATSKQDKPIRRFRKLHMNQPAISQTVNDLERQLGVKVTVQTSIGVRADCGLYPVSLIGIGDTFKSRRYERFPCLGSPSLRCLLDDNQMRNTNASTAPKPSTESHNSIQTGQDCRAFADQASAMVRHSRRVL